MFDISNGGDDDDGHPSMCPKLNNNNNITMDIQSAAQEIVLTQFLDVMDDRHKEEVKKSWIKEAKEKEEEEDEMEDEDIHLDDAVFEDNDNDNDDEPLILYHAGEYVALAPDCQEEQAFWLAQLLEDVVPPIVDKNVRVVWLEPLHLTQNNDKNKKRGTCRRRTWRRRSSGHGQSSLMTKELVVENGAALYYMHKRDRVCMGYCPFPLLLRIFCIYTVSWNGKKK